MYTVICITTAPTAEQEWTVNDMRLGDLDALIERADEVTFMGFQAVERKKHFMDLVSAMAESCTTIDAVPVVRCKDCKYVAEVGRFGCYCRKEDAPWFNDTFEVYMDIDDFCSYGERKGGEG